MVKRQFGRIIINKKNMLKYLKIKEKVKWKSKIKKNIPRK